MRKNVFSWLLIASLFSVVQVYAEEQFGHISVSLESINLLPAEHGYIEHRIRVSNHSPDTTYQVTLILPNKSYNTGYSHYIKEIRRTVAVGPSSSIPVCLSQPAISIYGDGNLAVLINGRYAGVIGYGVQRYNSGVDSGPKVLISRSLNSELFEKTFQTTIYGAETPVKGRTTPIPGKRAITPVRSEIDVAGWSENWLAYTSFDGIAVTAEDIQRMLPSVRLALIRYTECGGSLLVMGNFEVPVPWKTARCNTPSGLTAFYTGFGICILSRETSPENLGKEQIFFLKNTWDNTRQPWLSIKGEAEANKSFPVVKDFTIPVRPLFFLLFGIAIFIGPVNLFILRRMKRQIWLLWTTPAISLLVTLSIILYSLFSEGIMPIIRIENLTILDQVSRRATSIGITAHYFPLTQFGGLRASYDTECTPQVNRDLYSTSGRLYVLDWTHDQHLESGWVVPRMPVHLMVRKSEGRRERLETRQNGRAFVIINGLGADISELWLADSDGNVYKKTKIKAGTETEMELLHENIRAYGNLEILRSIYIHEWFALCDSVTKDCLRLLSPNTYIATFETCPFIEKGMIKKGKEKFRSVVFGILK